MYQAKFRNDGRRFAGCWVIGMLGDRVIQKYTMQSSKMLNLPVDTNADFSAALKDCKINWLVSFSEMTGSLRLWRWLAEYVRVMDEISQSRGGNAKLPGW